MPVMVVMTLVVVVPFGAGIRRRRMPVMVVMSLVVVVPFGTPRLGRKAILRSFGPLWILGSFSSLWSLGMRSLHSDLVRMVVMESTAQVPDLLAVYKIRSKPEQHYQGVQVLHGVVCECCFRTF
jgi:hypothetical protein